jgi:hypothetical protein
MSFQQVVVRSASVPGRYSNKTDLDTLFGRIAKGMRVDTVALREAVWDFVDAHDYAERDAEQLLEALNASAMRSGLLAAPGARVTGARAALIVQEATSLCMERLHGQ